MLCAQNGTATSLLEGLSQRELRLLLSDWSIFARDDQLPPEMAQGGLPWSTWLVMGGRGAGKTRTGAEWVRGMALGLAPYPPVLWGGSLLSRNPCRTCAK